jgi:hypothetical protein
MFYVSCFILHVSYFISYFKNVSDMNSVDSIRKMFDRTAWCIKRTMGESSWSRWLWLIVDSWWLLVIGDRAGCLMLEIADWRLEIGCWRRWQDLPVRFTSTHLCFVFFFFFFVRSFVHVSCLMFYVLCFVFHISDLRFQKYIRYE